MLNFLFYIFSGRKSYFQSPPKALQMIHIKCVNPDCPAHETPFEFDFGRAGTFSAAKSGEEGAEIFIIKCPICGKMNKVRLKMEAESKGSASYSMGATIIRRPPRHDQDSDLVDVEF